MGWLVQTSRSLLIRRSEWYGQVVNYVVPLAGEGLYTTFCQNALEGMTCSLRELGMMVEQSARKFVQLSTPARFHNMQLLDVHFRKHALGRFVTVADAQCFLGTKIMDKCRLKVIDNARDMPRADNQFFPPMALFCDDSGDSGVSGVQGVSDVSHGQGAYMGTAPRASHNMPSSTCFSRIVGNAKPLKFWSRGLQRNCFLFFLLEPPEREWNVEYHEESTGNMTLQAVKVPGEAGS